MKLNKKGFVLAETLVVAVFMATIFTIIYVNFYPLIGEYEKRENYDDLDSKYDIYWFKRLVQSKQALPTDKWRDYTGPEYTTLCDGDNDGYCDDDNAMLKNNIYIELIPRPGEGCTMFSTNNENGVNYRKMCEDLRYQTEIQKLYLTTYYLNDTNKQELIYKNPGTNGYFKKKINTEGDENIKDYVNYLPDYRFPSPNGARFRLVAQFKRHTNTDSNLDEPYYTYATIEVNRDKGV
ncbi:MAG: hypothetical protein IKE89_02380 [Bacilli bacterium]|nr:hypothetical protein [Bacilli bacterium]